MLVLCVGLLLAALELGVQTLGVVLAGDPGAELLVEPIEDTLRLRLKNVGLTLAGSRALAARSMLDLLFRGGTVLYGLRASAESVLLGLESVTESSNFFCLLFDLA